MTLTLHFTDKEIEDALHNHGYTITSEPVEQLWHVHGSRFVSETNHVKFAYKDGNKETIQGAFEELIKSKLLK